MTRNRNIWALFGVIAIAVMSCGEDPVQPGDLTDIPYSPVMYNPVLPEGFPMLEQPSFNPMTVEGVALGRKLFYDPVLSADSTMSCASCHLQSGNFTDNVAVSTGIDGIAGSRSSMSLMNIGFMYNGLFWDGRSATLEEQALLPVEDPIEMHHTWAEVVDDLREHPEYPADFRRAFGISAKSEISKEYAAFAIAQFERSLISNGNSRWDQWVRGEISFTEAELNGYDLFFDVSPDLPDAECAHCHSAPLFTTNEYFNNGLDDVPDLESFSDLGRGAVTGIRFDNGKFRSPSLRNIEYTAPYMHDGRFQTLEEVIEHYNRGGNRTQNTDPLIRPLGLSARQKRDLLQFLKTFSDSTDLKDEKFSSPF